MSPSIPYRSATTTQGRRMAGARALWRATGMRTEDFSKPIVAIANSFTQFVPGHAHLHPVGQQVKRVIDAELAQVILMWTCCRPMRRLRSSPSPVSRPQRPESPHGDH